MKKELFAFGLLLMCGLFSACGDDDDDVLSYEIIKPVCTSVEEMDGYAGLFDFFQLELPSGAWSKSFFVDSNKEVWEKNCIIVNSREKFEAIYKGDKELPELDFLHYSLVIGEVIMPHLGNECFKQELLYSAEPEKAILNLYVKKQYEYSPTVVSSLYCWGLYPKLDFSSVTINLILL